jgi:hypothetical protein
MRNNDIIIHPLPLALAVHSGYSRLRVVIPRENIVL